MKLIEAMDASVTSDRLRPRQDRGLRPLARLAARLLAAGDDDRREGKGNCYEHHGSSGAWDDLDYWQER